MRGRDVVLRWKLSQTHRFCSRTNRPLDLVYADAVVFCSELNTLQTSVIIDSYAQLSVVRLLRRIAQRGHTVITTLHNPSSELLQLLDDILIVVDGRVCDERDLLLTSTHPTVNLQKILFQGQPADIVPYFTSLGYRFPQFANPADVVFLEIIHTVEEESTAAQRERVMLLCDAYEVKL